MCMTLEFAGQPPLHPPDARGGAHVPGARGQPGDGLYIYACTVFVYIYIYMYMCIHMYMYVYIYIYI